MLWLRLAGFVAGAVALDRLLLWLESRGWLYYRKNKPSITSLGSALFQVQAIIQPEKQHIVETMREIKQDEDDDGDGKPKPTPPRQLPEPLD